MRLISQKTLWMGYFLTLGLACFAADENAAIREIGGSRQIFVDDYIIDRLEGTFLKMHEPIDKGMALKFGDSPCEDKTCGYVTVLKDENAFHLYYRGIYSEKGQGTYCYASSQDGINWIKPKLGVCEFKGSRDNNIILVGADGTHSFSPFIDLNPKAKKEERFKGLGLQRTPDQKRWVLLAFVSPDGIHWEKLQNEPVLTEGAFDSQNVSFWSESEGQYVCYYRTKSHGHTGIRRISRAVSEDFVHWSAGEQMEYRCRGQEVPIEELYINQTFPYFRAPDVYIATAARFMQKRRAVTVEQAESAEAKSLGKPNFADCSDAVLLSTRGGNIYERSFMEGWIRPGIGLENWTTRTNYPALNVVQTGPTEMSVYLTEGYSQKTARLQRYALRLDGFVSICAPYKGGVFITRPFRFEGRMLEVNYSTSAAGSIKVEIQDDLGKPMEGYTMEDCDEIIGDEIRRLVSWNKNIYMDNLQNKTIRLRFVMKDADLYSFKFNLAEN